MFSQQLDSLKGCVQYENSDSPEDLTHSVMTSMYVDNMRQEMYSNDSSDLKVEITPDILSIICTFMDMSFG